MRHHYTAQEAIVSPSLAAHLRFGWLAVAYVLLAPTILIPTLGRAQEPLDTIRTVVAPPGRIVGSAFDSTAAQPFDSATVLLLDPGGVEVRQRALTESDGRFSFDGVPPGDYVLVLEHDHLANLRLTPILRNVRAQSSGAAEVHLDSPSLTTMWEPPLRGAPE